MHYADKIDLPELAPVKVEPGPNIGDNDKLALQQITILECRIYEYMRNWIEVEAQYTAESL